MKVELYTTHCPNCLILEKKLKDKNVSYIEHTDEREMIKRGFLSVPVLFVEEKQYSFGEAIKWVNSLEG